MGAIGLLERGKQQRVRETHGPGIHVCENAANFVGPVKQSKRGPGCAIVVIRGKRRGRSMRFACANEPWILARVFEIRYD